MRKSKGWITVTFKLTRTMKEEIKKNLPSGITFSAFIRRSALKEIGRTEESFFELERDKER